MAESGEIAIPSWVLSVGCVVVVLGGGAFFALVAVLVYVTDQNVTGPGEAYNRVALDALVADLRAGKEPSVHPDVFRSPAVRAAIAGSASHAVDGARGGYYDATHGTTCFDVTFTDAAGTAESLVIEVDSDEGPPAVTFVALGSDCTCRNTGHAKCVW